MRPFCAAALPLVLLSSASAIERCSSGGVRVDHVCWQLTSAGQSCLDLCGDAVDKPLTINGASDAKVVHALDEGYGLKASYFDELDQPCHTSWLNEVRASCTCSHERHTIHAALSHSFLPCHRRSPAATT